jgi:protease-4
VIGLAAQFFFLGGLWEKLGAGVEALGSGEYKSGAETLSGTAMSPAHREMATSLLDSTYAQFVSGIAGSRGLSDEFVHRIIDMAPVTTHELEGMGFLDGTAPFPEAVASLGDGPVITASDYARVDFASVGFEPVARFALVYGSGTVMMGKGSISRTGGLVLTSDTVSEALEEAAEDPEVAAIIFRVDSPGGSPLASDIVWRAAARARERGKPLIASVSNYAASGGYYALCGADAIVAPPGSLVGSIGVFAVRPVIAGLLDKLGIGVESMTRGSYAGMLIPSEPLSERNRQRLRAEIDVLYDLFVARVAEGRGLDPEQVHEVGRGRVWTGAQAAENGLVDELGGLRTAVRRAKLAVGLDPDDDVLLVPYPAPQNLLRELDDALRRVASRALPQLSLVELARRFEPLVTSAPLGTPVLVPPFSIEIR